MPLSQRLSRESYRVGWICPLEVEQIAAMEMLDVEHKALPLPSGDTNIYNLGSINEHNVVIAGLPRAGNCSAATVVTQMRMSFPRIKWCLLVGIGGGVPVVTDNGMIRLGHVVVSEPTGTDSGTVQYDHGKAKEGHFERKGALPLPPTELLNAAREISIRRKRMTYDPIWKNVQKIRFHLPALRDFKFPGVEHDHLYPPNYIHQSEGLSCQDGGCDKKQRIERPSHEDDSFVVVHRGTIASGELVVKNAHLRDELAHQYRVLCFEMEAAGALNDFPCLVIRGISDYCDSHKNDRWHGYAAAVAAAYARQLFFHISTDDTR
jgi:nucleoside phosphorylase